MSKPLDTQQKARKVADQLLMEGIKPTQQNVRERMGTGSITTINKALTTWWQDLGNRLKANSEHPMIPDPVASTAAKLWHQAVGYARESLNDERQALEAEYREKIKAITTSNKDEQEELKQLRGQCLRMLQENERLSTDKYSLQKENADLENSLIRLNGENESLKREIKQDNILDNRGGGELEEYIELQVSARTVKEENKRLIKQLDIITNEKSALQITSAKQAGEIDHLTGRITLLERELSACKDQLSLTEKSRTELDVELRVLRNDN